jgi:hypothetical protein
LHLLGEKRLSGTFNGESMQAKLENPNVTLWLLNIANWKMDEHGLLFIEFYR